MKQRNNDKQKEYTLMATTTYRITVVTGDIESAGTDANVFITLFGAAWQEQRRSLGETS
jgi:hypothetical protein